MASINIDIDIDDLYWELRKREKEELVELLAEDGFCIATGSGALVSAHPSALDEIWHNTITKLLNARFQLNSEQEQMLIDLAKSL